MPKYRIAENEWNVGNPPWTGAVGIEEVVGTLAVPGVVLWMCRGGDAEALAERIVALLNAASPG
jgi:hypothetical protein